MTVGIFINANALLVLTPTLSSPQLSQNGPLEVNFLFFYGQLIFSLTFFVLCIYRYYGRQTDFPFPNIHFISVNSSSYCLWVNFDEWITTKKSVFFGHGVELCTRGIFKTEHLPSNARVKELKIEQRVNSVWRQNILEWWAFARWYRAVISY